MAYEKRTLVDGETPLDKELLDHLQDGIAALYPHTDGNDVTLIIPSSTSFASRLGGVANVYFVRCPDYSDDVDFLWWFSASGGSNGQTNIQHQYTTPKDTTNGAIYIGSNALTLWKTCTDDTAPLNFNGTYIGGNHGATIVEKVTVASHDKTTVDIGSVWTSNSHTYMLVKVVSDTVLWFVQTDYSGVSDGTLLVKNTAPSGTLVHSSGATNTADIAISSVTSGAQLTSAINNLGFEVYVDGEAVDITAKGTYTGKKVTIVNQYNIVYVPAMLAYLQDNVGNNTNTSFYDDAITEAYCTVRLAHDIHSNASMNVYQTIQFHKAVTLSTNFIAQMEKFALTDEGVFMYVPDTTLDTVTENTGVSHKFTSDIWNSEDKVPYRYYSFADADCNKGQVIIYDPAYGWGANEKRINRVSGGAGNFATTKKMYPTLISGLTTAPGYRYDAMAVRIPIDKYHDDLTSVVWYWRENGDIILCIDSHAQVNTKITLPDYMACKKVEILDQSDSVISETMYIDDTYTLSYATDADYGYTVLRLYD